jgi:hypothetical protein
MPTFVTKDMNIEIIKADILTALRVRNYEAEALRSHFNWKAYHIEIALHELIQAGLLVSYWTDSGAYQRKFYALADNFDVHQPVVQICASPETLAKLGEIHLTTRQEIRQARALGTRI